MDVETISQMLRIIDESKTDYSGRQEAGVYCRLIEA